MPKNYIRVEQIPKRKPTSLTQQDKIAKLYELADKLNVKIGGDDNDNQRPRKLLPDKP